MNEATPPRPVQATHAGIALTDVKVQLTGTDGNAFSIMGRVSQALKRAGHHDLSQRFLTEATSGDYDHLLRTAMRYVVVE